MVKCKAEMYGCMDGLIKSVFVCLWSVHDNIMYAHHVAGSVYT